MNGYLWARALAALLAGLNRILRLPAWVLLVAFLAALLMWAAGEVA